MSASEQPPPTGTITLTAKFPEDVPVSSTLEIAASTRAVTETTFEIISGRKTS